MALGERMKAFWGPRVPRREREGSRKSASQRRVSKSSKKQFRHVSIIGGERSDLSTQRAQAFRLRYVNVHVPSRSQTIGQSWRQSRAVCADASSNGNGGER